MKVESQKFFDQAVCSMVVNSSRVEDTQKLGRKIGRAVTTPVLIRLMGTLGCGKTAFVQGLAEGLEVPQEYYVTSPTFTLVNEYPGRLPLYHVDLYRLDGILELEDIGLDEILTAEGVVAVEWAEKLPPSDNRQGLSIRFEIRNTDQRALELIASGQPGCSLLKAINQ